MDKTIVYISCAESRQIQVFVLDTATGSLSLCQELPVTGTPLPLRVSPDGRFLYAGVRAPHTLLAFAIDPLSGCLSELGSLPAQGAPTYVACDRTGRWLFCASYGDHNLGVFSINAQGSLEKQCLVRDNLPHAHAALVDQSNQWLFVPMLGADAIGLYHLEGIEGSLSMMAHHPSTVSAAPGSGPRHPVLAGNNKDLYCLNELDGTINYYQLDAASGLVAWQQTVSMMPPASAEKPWAAELRLTADGRFLYATDRRSSTLAAFAVCQESGRLQEIDHYSTPQQPRGMDVDPSGRWLVVAGELSHEAAVFAIDQRRGALRPVSCHATGKDPICVEMLVLPRG